MKKVIVFFWLAACSSDAPSMPAPSATDDVAAPIVAALASKRVGAFERFDAASIGAQACARGTVEDLELSVCRFADREAGKAAMRRTLVGARTGVVRIRGDLVVAIADRDDVDARGQTLNQVLAALDAP